MKRLFYILAIVWALMPLGIRASERSTPNKAPSDITQPYSEKITSDQLPNKDLLLSSAQSLVCLGEEGGTPIHVYTQHSNFRPISHFKSAYRLIKNGKVIDGLHHPFVIADITSFSGTLSADRYLYAIRRIRI